MGNVLPVGGIKAKVLAAFQAGLHRVVLPQINVMRDLAEIPPNVREALEIIPVATVDEVLQHTLLDADARSAVNGSTPHPLAKL
jgi:ATP-dependent Lon protease